jgi:hypothetical protein
MQASLGLPTYHSLKWLNDPLSDPTPKHPTAEDAKDAQRMRSETFPRGPLHALCGKALFLATHARAEARPALSLAAHKSSRCCDREDAARLHLVGKGAVLQDQLVLVDPYSRHIGA